jgi:hypothetical protein
MTLPVLCFIFGAVFLLLGFGVDAEVMGVKVPRISKWFRPFAFVGGLAMMALPIFRPSIFDKAANVFIYEELADNQENETLEVTINGSYAGSIELKRPTWRGVLIIPATGREAHYKLSGRATEKVNNKLIPITSDGAGSVDLGESAVYAVATMGFSKGNYDLSLEKIQ